MPVCLSGTFFSFFKILAAGSEAGDDAGVALGYAEPVVEDDRADQRCFSADKRATPCRSRSVTGREGCPSRRDFSSRPKKASAPAASGKIEVNLVSERVSLPPQRSSGTLSSCLFLDSTRCARSSGRFHPCNFLMRPALMSSLPTVYPASYSP